MLVQEKGLPYEFQNDVTPKEIGNLIGNCVEIDPPNGCPKFAKKVRARIYLDIKTSLRKKINVQTTSGSITTIKLHYEGQPSSICQECWVIDHDNNRCEKKAQDLLQFEKIVYSFGTLFPQPESSQDPQQAAAIDSPIINQTTSSDSLIAPVIPEEPMNLDQTQGNRTISSDSSKYSPVSLGSRKWKRIRREDASPDSNEFKVPHISHVATHAYFGKPIDHCIPQPQHANIQDESIRSCPSAGNHESLSEQQGESLEQLEIDSGDKIGTGKQVNTLYILISVINSCFFRLSSSFY